MAFLNDEQKEWFKYKYQKFLIWKEDVRDILFKVGEKIKNHFSSYLFTYIFLVLFILFIYGNYWYVHNKIESKQINAWEIRYWLFYFLLMFVIISFGVLRIYNATVANTRFIILLKAEMKKLNSALVKAQTEAAKTRGILKSIQGGIQKLFNLKKED